MMVEKLSQVCSTIVDTDSDAATNRSSQILQATARLITTDVWRQRVVEQIKPVSADHYDLKRGFQFEGSSSPVDGLVHNDHVDTLLPVCWRPKHAMLNLDLTTTGGQSLAVLERHFSQKRVRVDGWRSCGISCPLCRSERGRCPGLWVGILAPGQRQTHSAGRATRWRLRRGDT